MKKSHPHTALSDKRCACGRPIKQRLVEQKAPHNIRECYKCGQARQQAHRNKKRPQ